MTASPEDAVDRVDSVFPSSAARGMLRRNPQAERIRGSRMALIDVGSKAPAFALRNQDGGTVSSDDFTGRYVLLWWYPKASTPG